MAENSVCFVFFSEKSCFKCLNMLIMRFDGSVYENLRGDFLEKMADSPAMSALTFSILMRTRFYDKSGFGYVYVVFDIY